MTTNVRALAHRVSDIELLAFEADHDLNPLPDRSTITELGTLAQEYSLTYTVHLPLDLRLADTAAGQWADKALWVIDRFRPLNPVGYVIHLETDVPDLPARDWVSNACRSVHAIADRLSDPSILCVENLEGQLPDPLGEVLHETPCSLCLDVGHVWKEGRAPRELLDTWRDRIRIVHLHGVAERDHVALSAMSQASLDPVIQWLTEFSGLVTLEVFREPDLAASFAALHACLDRVVHRPGNSLTSLPRAHSSAPSLTGKGPG